MVTSECWEVASHQFLDLFLFWGHHIVNSYPEGCRGATAAVEEAFA
jgi:hypothetical protein